MRSFSTIEGSVDAHQTLSFVQKNPLLKQIHLRTPGKKLLKNYLNDLFQILDDKYFPKVKAPF